ESTPGHLPICWAILSGALGLTLGQYNDLNIFIYPSTPGLLSASVRRLNEIGPYNAQQMLLHVSRGIINAEVDMCKDLRTGIHLNLDSANRSENLRYFHDGPANTWLPGEILVARHGLQHSRIFNP
ncbi:hypothetical protein F5877DRAFT_53180, partial [Lentinula edodes]